MSSAEFVNVYTFRDEVVVELTLSGDDVDVAVRSFQFTYDSDDTVTPKGTLEPDYRGAVEAALEDRGLSLNGAH